MNLEAGWIWGIIGLALLGAEVIAPGFFLVFLGVAALATALFTLLFDLSIVPQLVLFVIYTVLAVLIGKRWYAEPALTGGATALNEPGKRLVGRVVTVVDPVSEHSGRVRVGDSEWSARGGPAAAGEQVRITGVDGNCLKVEAERALPPVQ